MPYRGCARWEMAKPINKMTCCFFPGAPTVRDRSIPRISGVLQPNCEELTPEFPGTRMQLEEPHLGPGVIQLPVFVSLHSPTLWKAEWRHVDGGGGIIH
jgi:hypothetical protein